VKTVGVTDIPGRNRCSGSWPGVEHDLHGHALHDLHEVAGGVLGRQQAEARSGRGGNAVDLAVELLAAVGIDVHLHPLADAHVLELRLLEVRVIQTCSSGMSVISGWPGLNDLAGLDRLAAHDALDRRLQRGVFEVQFGAPHRGLRLLDARLDDCARAFMAGHLLRRRLAVRRSVLATCCATFDCARRPRATCTANSASRTCDRATATSAFEESACATAASYCCCDTSSLASSPFKRATSRSSRDAVASRP
jgi:hypothetical protein